MVTAFWEFAQFFQCFLQMIAVKQKRFYPYEYMNEKLKSLKKNYQGKESSIVC